MDVEFVITNYIAYLLAGSWILIPRREEEHISVVLSGWSWGVLIKRNCKNIYLPNSVPLRWEGPYICFFWSSSKKKKKKKGGCISDRKCWTWTISVCCCSRNLLRQNQITLHSRL